MWTSTLDAEPLEQWRRIAPEPTSTLIFDVAYGNQNFVIIGARGAIFTSTNGIDWVDRSLGRTNELRDIAYGNGVFTATGVSYGLDDALNGMVWTSADGAQWTGKAIDPIVGDIVFGNGLFAAVSPSSIMTSPDGIAWTPHPVVTPLPVSFRGIIYANGLFVVVGGGGTILTSSDGMTWTPRVSGVAKGLNDVAYGSNLFVVVGDSTILTSPDGIGWTKRQGDGGWDVASVRYVSGQFIAHGYLTLTSPDGVNWTPNPPGQLDHIKEVAYGNNLYVAISPVLTSPDGREWTQRTHLDMPSYTGLVFTGSDFVAFGMNRMFSSPDGESWTQQEIRSAGGQIGTEESLFDFAYGNGMFVAVGQRLEGYGRINSIYSSPDAITWTRQLVYTNLSNVPPYSLYGVTFGNGLFVAFGSVGTVFTSSNGVAWNNHSFTKDFPDVPALYGMAYGNGIFVTLGRNQIPAAFTSTNGSHWSRHVLDSSGINPPHDIAYGNGIFVAVTGEAAMRSRDGISWTVHPTGAYQLPRRIAYGHGVFVVVGVSGSLMTSPDGIDWTQRDSKTLSELNNVVYGKDRFLVVGEYGAILQSEYFGPLRLSAERPAGNTGFELKITSIAGAPYRLQASDSIISPIWRDLLISTNELGTANFLDTEASNVAQRFYRVTWP